ncbi:MAG: hypothetical protein HYZ72_10525, partial [Deltaproteobacteria bacterium]|nr:hypothetical protein [Deltaproteobacteria bacterium]
MCSPATREREKNGNHTVRYKIGIDVGGTFTDFLVTDSQGEATAYKTPTTPKHPEVGVFRGLEKITASQELGLKEFLRQVETIVHGTTITTNTVLTGDGAKTGFLTTKGFRDILNMRRGLKERQYDSKYSPPPPLVLSGVGFLPEVVRDRHSRASGNPANR